MYNLQHFPIKLIYFFVYEDCNIIPIIFCILLLTGNPLVYEDCNFILYLYYKTKTAGNPLVYEDYNFHTLQEHYCFYSWQPTCLRGLQPEAGKQFGADGVLATHLSTRIATTSVRLICSPKSLATHLSTRIATAKYS